MRLRELLNALSADAGVERDLAPDADGIVRLELDELSLAYKEQDDYPVPGHRAILMWGRFGKLPAEGADALVAEMLRANDREDDPSGPTFALIDDTFYLQRTLSADILDAESGMKATEDFLVALSTWHDRVAAYRPDLPGDGPAPAAGDGASAGSDVTKREDAERGLAVFRSIVCKMPAQGAETFRGAMLRANFLGGDTGAARLAVTANDEIVLTQVLPLALLDDGMSEGTIRRLSGMAQAWRRLVADYEPVAVRRAAEAEEEQRLARRMVASAFLRA